MSYESLRNREKRLFLAVSLEAAGSKWIHATMIAALVVLSPEILFGGLLECTRATCRISVRGVSGTGCAFEKTGSHLKVLTAAHVVGGNASVYCEFWKEGSLREKIRGDVLVAATREDLAVVAIPLENFGENVPEPIPIASKSRSLTTKEAISSVGCAGGGWSTSWVGHVSGAKGQEIYFHPPPAGGRSGSAIFDEEGTEILGVISARNNNTGEGIAVSVLAVHALLDRMKTNTPCPPRGNCVPLLGRSQPYVPPNADLNETNRRLDSIAELLKQIHSRESIGSTPEIEEEKRLSLLNLASMIKELRNKNEETTPGGSIGWSIAQVLCGALGISGPIGIAIGTAGWLVSRRLGRRIRGRFDELSEDATGFEGRVARVVVEGISDRIRELLEKRDG